MNEPSQEPPETSLRGELRAILVLYLILSILPLLIGHGCGPRGT